MRRKNKKFHSRKQVAPRQSVAPEGRVVVGFHAVREVFRVRPSAIRRAWYCPEMIEEDVLRAWAEEADRGAMRFESATRGALDKWSSGHQGIAVDVSENPSLDLSDDEHFETLLYLDGITDPHNLGAIVRSAWLFGAAGILTPERRSAHLTPTVSRIASGGAEHVAIESVSAPQNFLKDLKEKKFWVYGLSERADQSLHDVEFAERTVIVVGGEEKGVSKPIENQCDVLVRVPQVTTYGDLNASVAAAIVLYERHRQRVRFAGK